ncbi:reductive dehalogenase [Desulfosediminicola ganghwensis]|uniref:reductive dehalogenase n=1 Tax=Desulfosediminicola ganghwensis TaxID=2569540 RepID=UPI00142ED242|nr:reductive dehalogenase [Desulfosediminicola ganghwensis]
MSIFQSSIRNLSRRRFLQFIATVSAAASLGEMWKVNHAQAASISQRNVPFPQFTVKQRDQTAAEIYQCTADLKRYGSENMAFKIVSEELKGSSAWAMAANMIGNIKEGTVGHGWPVQNPHEARMYYALNVAMTTWNEIIGPYGENRENKGYLGWLPKKLPEKLTTTPLPVSEIDDLTKKIKIIASYAGADKVGITKIDRRWVFDTVCLNGLDPGPPEIKHIVFKDTPQPSETKSEFILPESVQYAIVIINVQPRALTQLAPSSIPSVASTNQGYAQGGLTAVALAQAIRSLGYVAIPCMNSTAMSVPLAIDAGLGELGRLGYLITPEWGPHVRIDKVLTNLPLQPDKPISFGVTEYCEDCGICAVECPSGAICPDKKRSFKPPQAAMPCGNPGALKWYADGKKCSRWWSESGAPCSNCMNVCPYTLATLGDGFEGKKPDPVTFWNLKTHAYGRRHIDY